jgi:hypothetical protein
MTASFSRRACDNSGSSAYARSSSCVCFKRCSEFCRRAISIDAEGGREGNVMGGDDGRDVQFMRGVNLSSISEKLVRAEPSVIVSGSNFNASENEKGCGYFGWYPIAC